MASANVSPPTSPARFPVQQMVLASRLYYLDDLTQAEIARRLGTSRASVSRLLSEARRQGIVQIEISQPAPVDAGELASATAEALGLTAVHLTDPAPAGVAGSAVPAVLGSASPATLGPALGEALLAAELGPGDVLLTASGRMIYESSRAQLPRLTGVVIAPMLGGQDEPEAWYQPNEITRNFCDRTGGRPAFLYAPALPGRDLYPILRAEPSICRVLELWATARCAIVGVGAPPMSRASIPAFVPTDAVSLRSAVGDVVSHFYDAQGREVPFPGSERLMATPLETLRDIPVVIAVATGREKVHAIQVGARAGYFSRLVTDIDTAELLLSTAARTPERSTAPRGSGRRANDPSTPSG